MLRSVLVPTILAVTLAAAACGQNPTAPSQTSGSPREPSADQFGQTPPEASRDALAVSATCTPTFKRLPNKYENMFPLTINFPSGCRWSARNNERGTVTWWLTSTTSDYKTHRYNEGLTAVGSKTVGIFYRGGFGQTHTLDVCLGEVCEAETPKVARYRFTY